MRNPGLCVIIWMIIAGLFHTAAFSQNRRDSCYTAFNFKTDEFAGPNAIKICTNTSQIPYGYGAEINIPVCDDTLCANVILKLYWDLAGNYMRFDTDYEFHSDLLFQVISQSVPLIKAYIISKAPLPFVNK